MDNEHIVCRVAWCFFMIDDLKHYNNRFAQNYSYGDENSNSVFEYIDRYSIKKPLVHLMLFR